MCRAFRIHNLLALRSSRDAKSARFTTFVYTSCTQSQRRVPFAASGKHLLPEAFLIHHVHYNRWHTQSHCRDVSCLVLPQPAWREPAVPPPTNLVMRLRLAGLRRHRARRATCHREFERGLSPHQNGHSPVYPPASLAQRMGRPTCTKYSKAGFRRLYRLWLLIHATRFGEPCSQVTGCTLECWREAGSREGIAARERLREGVEAAPNRKWIVLSGGDIAAIDRSGERRKGGALITQRGGVAEQSSTLP